MTAEPEYAAVPITMTVNGVKHEAVVEPRTLLVYFLREQLGLTGTHVGCDTSQCGACTIHLERSSCKILHDSSGPGQWKGDHYHRGTGAGRCFHPVQEGFREKHGLQCGYCTPGHDHDCRRVARAPILTHARRRSSTRWKATCAAARVTSILSNP